MILWQADIHIHPKKENSTSPTLTKMQLMNKLKDQRYISNVTEK